MKNKKSIDIINRSAKRDYFILDVLEAGLKLKGTEVKSLRSGRASLQESFARIEGNEIFLYKMHISPYKYGIEKDQDPIRPKKLLLNRREINYLITNSSQKGLTLVPLKVYFKNGYAKVSIAIVRGKRQYDKREAIKKKEAQIEIKRAKSFGR